MKKNIVKVLGYKTNERKQYASRADVLVQYDDGTTEVIKDKCVCGWCCRTCKLQNMLLTELLSKHREMIRRSKHKFSHAYPASTNKKWFFIKDE